MEQLILILLMEFYKRKFYVNQFDKKISSYTHLIYTVKYAAYNYVSENVLKIKISVNLQNDNYSYVPKNGFFLKTFF